MSIASSRKGAEAAGELGFRDRVAYLRWLRNRGRVTPETDDETAAAWGVGLPWLKKWKARPDSPEGRTEHNAIVAAIGAEAAAWLYDGVGEPLEPALWPAWLQDWERARRDIPTAPRRVAEQAPVGAFIPMPRSSDKPAAKKKGRSA